MIHINIFQNIDLKYMQKSESKELLCKEWDEIYCSKDAKLILVGNVQGYQMRKEKSHYIIMNPSLVQKRAGQLVGMKEKSVFVSFDPKAFNFTNVSNKEMLFHINLDEEEIISKENAHKITENFFDKDDDEEDQIEGHTHPLLINTAPVCRYHSILSMYPDEELPQIIGSDILLLLLNIFKVLPGVKLGYNSIGAGATVNHLHFHLLYSEDLIGCERMPIESAERTLFLRTSLINPNEDINLYSVGIEIGEIVSEGRQALVLSPYSKEPIEYAEMTNSLSFVFGIIVNELIELSIPHNLLITEDGHCIYIFIRDFCLPDNRYGWMEYSGVVAVPNEKEFAISEEYIIEKKKKLFVDNTSIELLKNNIKKHLSKFL